MNAIETALGREIVRVETGDFDEMEKVSTSDLFKASGENVVALGC